MCKRHWFKLPQHMRRRIWRAYRPGQCDDWKISHEYAQAAIEAVRWLAAAEGVDHRKAVEVYSMLDPGPAGNAAAAKPGSVTDFEYIDPSEIDYHCEDWSGGRVDPES